MISVEEENHIKGLDVLRSQFVVLVRLREHHMQEIGGVPVVRLGINDRQASDFRYENAAIVRTWEMSRAAWTQKLPACRDPRVPGNNNRWR